MDLTRKSLNRVPLAPVDVAQRYTIEEALSYLRISRASIYKEINSCRLQVIKQGGRTFVPGSEIARLSRLEGENNMPANSMRDTPASLPNEKSNTHRLLDSHTDRLLMQDIDRQRAFWELVEKFDRKLQYLVVLVERLADRLPEKREGAGPPDAL
jgi:helix-turn-helix protein